MLKRTETFAGTGRVSRFSKGINLVVTVFAILHIGLPALVNATGPEATHSWSGRNAAARQNRALHRSSRSPVVLGP